MNPIILTFVGYYLPGYRAGGPIRTIANMVEKLGDEFDFRIVTLDRDMGDLHAYADIQSYTWIPCGKALVQYVSQHEFGVRKIAEIVNSTPHDVIYLNSFFDPLFTLQVLINRRLGRLGGHPIVIAPRGQFSEGALQLKSLKKSVFIGLAKLSKLYNGLTWQASSFHEVEAIQRVMSVGKKTFGNVAVAGNLVSIKTKESEVGDAPLRNKRVGIVRACFLSRISPKKNLDYGLRMLAKVRVPVKFSIFGPIEDARYWAECQELIAKLPSNVVVVYEGLVKPTQVISKLMQNDLFLFPTRGENFGHVIHEALRAGLPLLISNETPWRGLTEKGVGWDLPLDDVKEFVSRIEEVAGWTDAEHQQYASRARTLAAAVAEDHGTLEANRHLFLDAIKNSASKSQVII